MPTVKLTPDMLKRIVLEEKKKLDAAASKKKLDKAALKDLEMDMDEADFASGKVVKAEKPPKGNGAGDVSQYKTLKKLEENLIKKLEQVRESKLALRRKILANNK